jgi:hypothetical protein
MLDYRGAFSLLLMTPCIYHLYMEMAKDYIPKKRIVEAKQKH